MVTLDTIKIKERLLHIRMSKGLADKFRMVAQIKGIDISKYIRILIKRELVRQGCATRHTVDNL